MTNRAFRVRPVWDAEAHVYYSESDIIGLHIEAASLDEFEQVLMDVGPDLIVANHLSAGEIASTPLRDLVPTILLEQPVEQVG